MTYTVSGSPSLQVSPHAIGDVFLSSPVATASHVVHGGSCQALPHSALLSGLRILMS